MSLINLFVFSKKRGGCHTACASLLLAISLTLMAQTTNCLAVGTSANVPSKAPSDVKSEARTSLDSQAIRAQLSPKRFTSLSAELAAKVNHIAVKDGDRFKAGQVLISLDCSIQNAQLQKAKASLDAADKLYAANKRLAELNSVGKLELDTSQSEVSKSKADVSLIATTLQKCAITAPFSGRVAEQKVREQQFVQAGQPILDILDDSTLELEFIVPSKWLVWIKNDYKFQVKIDETGKDYPAKITRLGARIDPISQTIKVAAIIDGKFPELIAGMSGRIELNATQSK